MEFMFVGFVLLHIVWGSWSGVMKCLSFSWRSDSQLRPPPVAWPPKDCLAEHRPLIHEEISWGEVRKCRSRNPSRMSFLIILIVHTNVKESSITREGPQSIPHGNNETANTNYRHCLRSLSCLCIELNELSCNCYLINSITLLFLWIVFTSVSYCCGNYGE